MNTLEIKEVSILDFELPLNKPLLLKEATYNERVGLMLQLTSSTGKVAWGEVAPLPGWDNLELTEARAELELFVKLAPRLLDYGHFSPFKDFWGLIQGMHFHPVVQWGIEAALWNLFLEEGLFPWPLPANKTLLAPSSGLLFADESIPWGPLPFPTYKIKIGRLSFEKEIDFIRRLARKLPREGVLRLDPNDQLTTAEVVKYVMALRGVPIEYIEDMSFENSPWELALDDRLKQCSELDLENTKAKFLIIKPGALGGICRALRLQKNLPHIKFIFSSAYNTELFPHLITLLIHAFPELFSTETRHGFDTLKYFRHPWRKKKIKRTQGSFQLPVRFM